MDLFHRLAPHTEYLLQGSILDNKREILLHRLNGLCDTNNSIPDKFCDHEITYVLRGQQNQNLTFRIRKALDDESRSWRTDTPLQVRYMGGPESDRGKVTLVRTNIDVACSKTAERFLIEMGFKKEHEHMARGYFFRKGRMRISVYKIFRIVTPDFTQCVPVTNSNMVELSVLSQASHDSIQEEVRIFADQLLPLVTLEKLVDLNQMA